MDGRHAPAAVPERLVEIQKMDQVGPQAGEYAGQAQLLGVAVVRDVDDVRGDPRIVKVELRLVGRRQDDVELVVGPEPHELGRQLPRVPADPAGLPSPEPGVKDKAHRDSMPGSWTGV